MKTKLTLSVSPEAVLRARRLATSKGQSISSLFEKWASRLAESAGGPGLAESLRGRWKKGAPRPENARLAYLLEKHARR